MRQAPCQPQTHATQVVEGKTINTRFDDLTKSFAIRISRRRAIGGTVGVGLAALLPFGRAAAQEATPEATPAPSTDIDYSEPVTICVTASGKLQIVGTDSAGNCEAVAYTEPEVSESVEVDAMLPGQTLPKGSLVVLRHVNNKRKTVRVFAAVLGNEVKFGPLGMLSIDGWTNYESWNSAVFGACGEAMARSTGATLDVSQQEENDPLPWEWGYKVFFFNGDVPVICNPATLTA